MLSPRFFDQRPIQEGKQYHPDSLTSSQVETLQKTEHLQGNNYVIRKAGEGKNEYLEIYLTDPTLPKAFTTNI